MTNSIAFIGVGNMGCPMAENLMKAGQNVKVFDVSKKMLEIAKDKNLNIAENLSDLITGDVGTVITMLPEGKHSKEVYLGENGIIDKVSENCLLIDCSTIDIQTSIEIGKKASEKKIDMINKETIEYLHKGAIVTNVASGDIVDDDAMRDAFERRKVYALGLDVYKNEPNLNIGYLKHKSAFILPHLCSATKDTRTAMANLAIDNLDEFFRTGTCVNKVN